MHIKLTQFTNVITAIYVPNDMCIPFYYGLDPLLNGYVKTNPLHPRRVPE